MMMMIIIIICHGHRELELPLTSRVLAAAAAAAAKPRSPASLADSTRLPATRLPAYLTAFPLACEGDRKPTRLQCSTTSWKDR